MVKPDRTDTFLTDEEERIVRKALISGATRYEAAQLIGISQRRLETRLKDQLSDLKIGQGRRGKKRNGDWDIDADEIARRCAAIRARWSDAERQSRLGNFTAGRFES